MNSIIITGGAGFIGSNLVRLILRETPWQVVILDKMTYAGHEATLTDIRQHGDVTFYREDIADEGAVARIFQKHQPSWIVNCAAETHVDRSIDGPEMFLKTNTTGTFVLLECSRRYLRNADQQIKQAFRFLHVSTDEVFGSLGPGGRFSESSAYAPNSPYAASKAAADHFVRAYWQTYKVPTLITNCSNNYGPFQYPEKLIPLTIVNALEAKPLRIYGDGLQVRDWLFVEDHCRGILAALQHGRVGEQYCIGGEEERTNLDIVDRVCAILQELHPASDNIHLVQNHIGTYRDLKQFVTDRPGHDRRYAIDPSKSKSELGWTPQHTFDTGLRKTVEWYISNRKWCDQVLAETYNRERLGVQSS